jgi:hypothetical protein
MKWGISINKGFCDNAVRVRRFRLDFNLILCQGFDFKKLWDDLIK